jgi:hypothetical protein
MDLPSMKIFEELISRVLRPVISGTYSLEMRTLRK